MQLSLVNPLDKRGTSLIEIMAMIAVVGLAIAAMFSTVTGGMYFAKDSENRIKAINLAREGIEGVTNIRNTNWLRFSSDQANCWKSKDYNGACIGDIAGLNTTIGSGTYTLENRNGAWYLTGTTAGLGLWVDSNGFYVNQSTGGGVCTMDTTTSCKSPFSREIQISIPMTNTNSMTVTSIVRWQERVPQSVTLTTTLTNWKSKF